MAGRFLPQRDIDVFERVNKELIGDLLNAKDGIINQTVTIYKISAYDTKVNLYGEAQGGKVFQPGVKVACIIESEDFDFNVDEFGPDLRQNAIFRFLIPTLLELSLVTEIGDLVEWNYAHWEVSSVNENQLVGGQYNQNWSVDCSAHLIRKSSLNIQRVRSI